MFPAPAPKNSDATQNVLASSDGTRAGAGGATAPAGSGLPMLGDPEGRLFVSPSGAPPSPAFPTRAQFAAVALVDNAQALAAGGSLVQVTGFNTGGAAYAQLYDRLVVPGAADVPIQSMLVPALGAFGWSPGDWLLANGLWVVLSTTPIGYTSAGATLYYQGRAWVA